MIGVFRTWAAWLRKEFNIKPGELGDMFAAFQIVSGFGGFVIAFVVWIVSKVSA